ALATALANGSSRISFTDLPRALLGQDGGVAAEIVTKLRLPRALAAFASGALLAVAGALMQVLLRNPLADPYVLGLSGGAGVGALAAIASGHGAWTAPAALAGALVSTALVFWLAREREG